MQVVFEIGRYFLAGKSLSAPIRRTLSLFLNLTISIHVYTWLVGDFIWLDYDDYKGILDFFLRGYFIIPFAIFCITSLLIHVFGWFLFFISTHFESVGILRTIREYQSEKQEFLEPYQALSHVMKHALPIDITPAILKSLYSDFKRVVLNELGELRSAMNEALASVEAYFILFIRLIIAIAIIADSPVAPANWISWVLVFCIIGILIGLVFTHLFLGAIPSLIEKIYIEINRHFLEDLKEENGKESDSPENEE